MIILVFMLLVVIIKSASLSLESEYNLDYIGKEQCKNINGIFVIMVFLSHYYQYIVPSSEWQDTFYIVLREHLNQAVVMTFLFFSGYGMMESVRRKGYSYVISLLKKFIRLLIKFDIAVVIFLILGIALGIHYDKKQILLSLICWDSIGNSNWYIFVSLSVYLLIFVAFSVTKQIHNNTLWHYTGIFIFTLLTMGLVVFLMKTGRDGYWYNTAILVPLGFLFSMVKDKVDKLLEKGVCFYPILSIIVLAVYIFSYFKRFDYGIEGYTIWAISFIGVVILISMKLTIRSRLLEWTGSHIFSIYILQRLPMIVLYNFGCIESHKYISLIVSIVVTASIAPVFDKITDKLLSSLAGIKSHFIMRKNNMI